MNDSEYQDRFDAYLGQVAGDARARFETALLRVALHEGLILPP